MSDYQTTDRPTFTEAEIKNEIYTYIKESFDEVDHHDALYMTVFDQFTPIYYGELCDFMLEHRLMSVLVETNVAFMSTSDMMTHVIRDYLYDMVWESVEDILAEEAEE